jgi:branched-chain amino acid transport system substrate-binding protein
MSIVTDQIFTPPLSDATSLVQAVRASRPDWLFLPATSTQDNALIIQKLNEFGLGKGRLPTVANSGQVVLPEMRNLVSADLMEGVLNILGFWPNKEAQDVVDRFKTRFNEPWMISDAIEGYADIQLFKEAIERAGSADKEKVAQALRVIDLKDGPAKYFPGGRVRFDEKGRRIDAEIVVVQWQKGIPVLVYPLDVAVAKAIWPKQ